MFQFYLFVNPLLSIKRFENDMLRKTLCNATDIFYSFNIPLHNEERV